MPDAIPLARSTKADTAPQSDATAEELLAFERMLADLSARFANVPAEKVQFEIQVAQALLRQFLGFDRSTCAEFQDDGSLVVLSSTAVDGVDPTPLGPLPSQLSWFVAKLRAGEIFAVQNPAEDLPPEAVGEGDYFRRTGLHSHLTIPSVLAAPLSEPSPSRPSGKPAAGPTI
jgi:GAF domain-containing protein